MGFALEILERKFSLYVIMAVKENPGSKKTEITKLEGGNERTKFLRINDVIGEENKQHNAMRLYLTPRGQEVASHLEKIQQVLERVNKQEDIKE
ncbi:MAG: hypothetical protein FWG96_06705 [Methanomassiliicoccaceae archaeon]|nr:hypothetical protein [Methanomassiliicoccaceae archaeon]